MHYQKMSTAFLGNARLIETANLEPLEAALQVLDEETGLELEALLVALEVHAEAAGDAALLSFSRRGMSLMDLRQ